MKHRLGVSVGVVLLGIGVAPFWMGKSGQTTHPATETAAASSNGKREILVASAADDYIPPLLGFTDDDLIDNPRLNPVLALTGADADEEPGRLTFAAEYLPRLPVAPSLLLMGGYDAPRLTPFPNPGAGSLNLFGGNQFDPTGAPSLDSSAHAMNSPVQRPDLGYPPAAPTSINPAAPLTYPRPTPGLGQPMPNPQGPAQGGYGPPAGQNPGPGYGYVPAPGFAPPPPAGYGAPAPGFGAPPQYPMGRPEMLAYAGPDSPNPAAGPTPPPPMAGAYPQAAQPSAAQACPPANYGPQAGFGYGPACGCQNGRGFGGPGNPYYGANLGGFGQHASMMGGGQLGFGYAGQAGYGYGGYSGYTLDSGFGGGQFRGPIGYGGFHDGMMPTSFGGSYGEESGYGRFGGSNFGCCQPSMGCCSMPVSCCGSEMGGFAMGGGMSYGGGCNSGCGSQRRGLFCRLKDWFKGGSRCCNDNYYDGCNEQKSCGLFSRLKNLFRKKKDGCCQSYPMYASGGDCCGFEGGFAGGYSSGFDGGYSGGYGH